MSPSLPLAPPAESDSSWLIRMARSAPLGIYRCDGIGVCTFANDQWCQLTGLSMEEAMKLDWKRSVHADDQVDVAADWRRLTEERVPMVRDFRFQRPNRSVVWVHADVKPDRDAGGKVVGFVFTVTDLSDLKYVREEMEVTRLELEERVRERSERALELAMVVDLMRDAVVRSNLLGRITGWNRGAENLFGYTVDEMLGGSTMQLTPPEEQAFAKEISRRVTEGKSIDSFEAIRIHKSGELIRVEISVFPLRDSEGKVVGSSAMIRDMTERRRTEWRLRQLSQRLLSAQDDERRRIARELHDSTAQLLAALSINLSQLAAGEKPLTEQRREQMITECADFAERALAEVRTQSYLLHPPLLDERGLVAALGFFIEGFSKRSGIKVTFRATPLADSMTKTGSLTLFRVVQEALTNVHRHSNSQKASISLDVEEGTIKLTIRDHGKGHAKDVQASPGVGIAGMRERVEQIGGKFYVEGASPGIRIVVKLPLESAV